MSQFKIARTRSTDVMVAATSIASIIANVADMAQFLPARAAASVALVILQTVQEIDNNKVACYKLARRSAKILVDLNTRMAGRWESAPKALVENIQDYERVLVCIRDFMQELQAVKWMGRLFRKGSIEGSLSDFQGLLDESERSFQMASLIEIHYTVGILQERSAGKAVTYVENVANECRDEDGSSNSTDVPSNPGSASQADSLTKLSVDSEKKPITHAVSQSSPTVTFDESTDLRIENDIEELQLRVELDELERFGFKRYHQTDLLPLSEVKSDDTDSFWNQLTIADAGGKRVMVKRYDNATESEKRNLKKWLHDVKTLRNLYHPNLPQLAGYSDEKSQVPFIVLAQTKLREPSAYFLNALRNMNIAEGAIAAVRIAAALYVQRQLSLDERATQQFIAEASYRADTQCGKLIVGIPPPNNGVWGFGYPLTESLLGTTMRILPDGKTLLEDQSPNIIDMQDKLAHIRALARVLLPSADQEPNLGKLSEALLEDADFEMESGSISLPLIRNRSIRAGTHDFAWHTEIHSCPVTFTVGDIGYISRSHERVSLTDKSRFNKFVKVGNVVDDLVGVKAGMDDSSIIREVTGSQGQWINGFHKTVDAWPFVLPGEVEGWPVTLTPGAEMEVHVRHSARLASNSDAWRCLLRQAESQAKKLGVNPHELILITKTISGQIYRVRDWNPTALPLFKHPPSFPHGAPFHGHAFGQHMQLPRVLYLFTSFRSDFIPFVADNPAASNGHTSPRSISLGTAWHRPEAFIDYIQLSEEDFVSR